MQLNFRDHGGFLPLVATIYTLLENRKERVCGRQVADGHGQLSHKNSRWCGLQVGKV